MFLFLHTLQLLWNIEFINTWMKKTFDNYTGAFVEDPLKALFRNDPEMEHAWKRENELRVMVEDDAVKEDGGVKLHRKRPVRASHYFSTPEIATGPVIINDGNSVDSVAIKSISTMDTVEIPIAYNPYNIQGGEIRVRPNMQLHAWRKTYGSKDSAKCILCKVNRINRTGPSCNAGHVNPKCRGGMGTAVWMFVFQCAECNQIGKRTENTFDQLVASGRNDKIVLVAHLLFRLYCEAEADRDVTFGGLADFVELVYGRHSAKSRGGVKSEQVFQLLYQEDVKHPMLPELRNPFLRARSNVERHYYNTLEQF